MPSLVAAIALAVLALLPAAPRPIAPPSVSLGASSGAPASVRPAAASGALAGHPDSRSTSRVRVQDAVARVELVCQARSVAEALPLDIDGDGQLDAAEVDAGRDALGRYVLARYQLFPARGEDAPGRVPALEGRLVALRWIPPVESAVDEARIAAELEFDAGARIEALTLRVRLFREQNPFHRDEARLEFQGDQPARHLFSGEEAEVWSYATESERRPGVFADYAREGVRHIATGFDHLAFLLALLLAARRWQSVLLVVTAFTLAHTLTLALATFEVVRAPSSLVEMAIALSVAYVGALNLLAREASARWPEAFVFGLVHGLGFAGGLRDSLAFEDLRGTALFGFNAGVEAGQLAIVLPLALCFAKLPGSRGPAGEAKPDAAGAAGEPASPRGTRSFLAPRWLRVPGSALVVALGLWWFAERAGFLP